MTFEIIDNFLPKEDFEKIKNSILNPYFSWNLTPTVSNSKEDLKVYCSYYFTHEFWSGFHIEPESQLFVPILNQLDCKSIIRIKGNLYPSTPEIEHHDNHIDYDFSHRGAIFYLNTNNGLTVLEDTIEIKSIENRLLIFDASIPHHSTTCSNDKCRVNINFNFF
jgi:hypothetical protein